MTRNENYWLMAPDGEPYPYLDEIEFLVQDENQTRDNAIISGDIDITHMDSGDSIERLRQEADNGTINLFEIDQRQETGYVLINSSDPNAAVSDVRIRQAMAYAFDHVVENQSRNAGIFEIANGPFSPGSIGYLEDTGFPEFDLEQATRPGRRVRGRHRAGREIAYKTTTDPFNLQTAELYQRLLGGGGHDRHPRPDRTGRVHHPGPHRQLRGLRLAQPRRLRPGHPGGVVDESRTPCPAGEIALNFGRIDDPVIDENLDIVRESQDAAERQAAAEAINRQFAEQVYNIWTNWVDLGHPLPGPGPRRADAGGHARRRPVDGDAASASPAPINLHQLWVDDAGA